MKRKVIISSKSGTYQHGSKPSAPNLTSTSPTKSKLTTLLSLYKTACFEVFSPQVSHRQDAVSMLPFGCLLN